MSGDPFGIEKSAAAVAGRSARQVTDGFGMGRKLASMGHSPMGTLGSGAAGKPTFTVKSGSKLKRAGIHAGVAAGNAPLIGAAAAGGAAVEHAKHVRKGFLKDTGIAGTAGVVGAELAKPGVVAKPLGTITGKVVRAAKLIGKSSAFGVTR